MFRPYEILPVAICTACLISCCMPCTPDIGQPLDLSQFSGQWYFAAGTPVNESLSTCGKFLVRQTGDDTFSIKYAARRMNVPIAFNVDGKISGGNVTGFWQLEGSERRLGPFRHVVMFAKYDVDLGLLVCSENMSHLRGYKFAMIWSRERRLPLPILEDLKSKLGAYINQGEIRVVDHENC